MDLIVSHEYLKMFFGTPFLLFMQLLKQNLICCLLLQFAMAALPAAQAGFTTSRLMTRWGELQPTSAAPTSTQSPQQTPRSQTLTRYVRAIPYVALPLVQKVSSKWRVRRLHACLVSLTTHQCWHLWSSYHAGHALTIWLFLLSWLSMACYAMAVGSHCAVHNGTLLHNIGFAVHVINLIVVLLCKAWY